MLVRELGEAELRARPEDELLREARRVHRGERRGVKEVRNEVPVGDGVDAVAERALETQLAGHRLGVDRMRGAGERPGAEGGYGGALARVCDALPVASERLDVREEHMRQRDGLRALQVRVAGEHCVDLAVRALDERQGQLAQRAVELVAQIDHEETQVEGDLVVAAARRMQLSRDRTDALAQHALDR